MPKFKVGDMVRILPRKPEWRTHWPYYTDYMQDHSLKIDTVGDVHPHEPGCITLSSIGAYWWHEDWLEPVKKRKFL